MRTRIALTGMVLVFLLVACSAGSAQISAETTDFSFGEVVNGDIVSKRIEISNAGDKPLVVEAISTSCGCTKTSLDNMEIAPGESSTLIIRFDSGAHGPGVIGKLVRQVFIASNDPQQPELVITFNARVVLPPDD